MSRVSAELLLSGVHCVLRIVLRDHHRTEMAMGSDSPADGRSGVTSRHIPISISTEFTS